MVHVFFSLPGDSRVLLKLVDQQGNVVMQAFDEFLIGKGVSGVSIEVADLAFRVYHRILMACHTMASDKIVVIRA